MDNNQKVWIVIIIILIVIIILWLWWMSFNSTNSTQPRNNNIAYKQKSKIRKHYSQLYQNGNNIFETTKPISLPSNSNFEIVLPHAQKAKYTVTVEIDITEKVLTANTPENTPDGRNKNGYIVSMENNISKDSFCFDTLATPIILPPQINRQTRSKKTMINLESNNLNNIDVKFRLPQGVVVTGYIKASIYSHDPYPSNALGFSIRSK